MIVQYDHRAGKLPFNYSNDSMKKNKFYNVLGQKTELGDQIWYLAAH